MIQNHTSKRFLSALLIGVSLLGQTLQTRPKIVVIENNSETPAQVAGGPGTSSINGATQRRLKLPLFIPFVSVAKYRDAFISGDPYFPQEALIVKTVRGRYAIWRDETGVVCALEHIPGLSRDECVPVTLFKQGNETTSQNIIQSLILLLTINKQGEVNLIEKTI